jgi:amphi-Trp domain-containing protein
MSEPLDKPTSEPTDDVSDATEELESDFEEQDDLYEEEVTLSAAEIAQRLRALADMFETGAISLEGINIALPDTFYYEVEIERDDEDDDEVLFELDIAVGWSAPA